MKDVPSSTLNPGTLPPGTQVGPWRVVEWAGNGVHSTVYRAVPVEKEHATAVALKLARLPGDPRFAREEELLARVRHPSVPRLWDAGEWQDSRGARYPFIAMEWVEGLPLYAWAEQRPPSTQQVLQWLSQLARALRALHALGGLHRDLKGGNILVRRSDGRAMLVDFGSCLYPEAVTLTPAGQFVGTPAYRAPESALFELQSLRAPSTCRGAQPAEDLYALGVTACRLVTGEYPQFAEPWKDAQGQWHLEEIVLPDALQRVELPVSAVVKRLLSVCPEERGTAARLAEELEQALRSTQSVSEISPVAEAPRASPASLEPPRFSSQHAAPPRGAATPVSPQANSRPWRMPLAAGALLLGAVAGAWWAFSGPVVRRTSPTEHEVGGEGSADAGTAGLGELASAEMKEPVPSAVPESAVQEAPPEPRPGQIRPDAQGRCPRKQQVALNGGCWMELDPERCEALNLSFHLDLHLYRGACYVPVLPPGHPPTSTPASPR